MLAREGDWCHEDLPVDLPPWLVPVARADGTGYDLLRACVEGPVFNPARILWDRWTSEAPRMLPTPAEGLPVVRAWPG